MYACTQTQAQTQTVTYTCAPHIRYPKNVQLLNATNCSSQHLNLSVIFCQLIGQTYFTIL